MPPVPIIVDKESQDLNLGLFKIIFVLGTHCDIYKSFYNVIIVEFTSSIILLSRDRV
jgi:hypothetical protein